MTEYKKFNLITGWFAFAVAAVTYIMTMEPTASLWDCAEFIATSYKLEVGHPPGAPLFMMIARFFTIFAPSPEKAALMVNLMSSLCGAFTVLFLCWSITHLARKIYQRNGNEMTKGQMWTVLGAGLIGSLAYCWTDTQWFSAVEGEVYSMSSMFTAMVFWAILKWENVADQPHSNCWLILIAYLMGLSIGIHILNLLTIPALVFVYYFRKYPQVTTKGIVWATLASGAIIIAINYIIMPYSISVGAFFDRIFVNGLKLPVNSGLVFFVVALFALCAWGVYYTHKKGHSLANTLVLCTTVILLGYGSYASVVIRAAANPPMNSNDPSNPYGLQRLIGRDQYGNRPLFYGEYYTSPPEEVLTENTYYLNDAGDRYQKAEMFTGYKYPDQYKYLFPRLYSSQREQAYKNWVDIKGRREVIDGKAVIVPTLADNLKFFFNYQMNFMYWRYFLWNFVGRQSDVQSTGQITDGNWLSGINFIDKMYLGPQDNLPSEMANNKGRNTYFFLPFLLGVIGLVYQLVRDKRNFVVVMWLFVMMGIALVVYFNTTPGEPRERDYVYAGSFYAFCIWIGFGVLWLRDLILRFSKKDNVATAVIAIVVCAVVPGILVAQNWDDHDRSHRYTARDVGYNFLEATLPNSVLVCSGDNDTFPLWYNQEVEGVRTDVKVMNMSYLGADWYIDQMKLKSNEADPLPLSLPRSKYVNNTNEVIYVLDQVPQANLKDAINFIKNDSRQTQVELSDGTFRDYMPTKKLLLPVNKQNAVESGIVKPEDAHLMEDTIVITLNKDHLVRNELMFLDLLANFDWKRPIFFTQIHFLPDFGLTDYLQFDGSSYRLVPIINDNNAEFGRVDTEYLYPRLMEQFRWSNLKDPRVYSDFHTRHMIGSARSRQAFARLAGGLLAEGDTVRAVQALDRALEMLPSKQVGYDYYNTAPLIENYYKAGELDKGNALLEEFSDICKEYITYFLRFPERSISGKRGLFDGPTQDMVMPELEEKVTWLHMMYLLASTYGQDEQANKIDDYFVSIGLK